MARGGRVKLYFEADTGSLEKGTKQVVYDIEKVSKAGDGMQAKLRGAAESMALLDNHTGTLGKGLRTATRGMDNLARAEVSVSHHTASASRSMEKQTKGTTFLGGKMKDAAKGVAGFIAAYAGVSVIEGAATATLDLGAATDRLSVLTGLSIKKSSEWVEAAKQREIEATSLTVGFTTLAKNIKAATDASGTQRDAFEELGVSMEDLRKKNFQQTVLEIADRMEKLGPGFQRAALMSKLFGRSAQSLVGLLASGSKGVREQLDLVEKHGAALDKNEIKKIREAAAAQRELGYAFDGLKKKVSLALFDAGKSVKGWVDDIKNAKGSVGRLIHDINEFLGPVLSRGIKGAVLIFRGFAQTIGGIAKVIDGILTLRFDRAWDGIKDIFRGGAKVVVGTFKGLTAPLIGAAKVVDRGLTQVFGGMWKDIKGIFRDGLDAIVSIVNKIIGVINVIPGVDIGKVGGGGGVHVPGNATTQDAQHPGGVGRATGGPINKPTVMVGEEAPQHPEWVIATNPRYRQDNIRYWMKAGSDLGVPGYAAGGPIGSAVGAVGGAIADAAGKGAGFFASKLPTPHLPSPFTGLGPWLITQVKNWITEGFKSEKFGGTVGGIVPSNLQRFNRTYPSHSLAGAAGHMQFNAAITGAIAASAGLPGSTFAKIAHGESQYYPGIYSSDGGHGLWQMTPRVQSASTVAAWNRIGSYYNPIANARMAKYLYDRAPSKTPNTPGFPWFGTQYLAQGGRIGQPQVPDPPSARPGSPPAAAARVGGDWHNTAPRSLNRLYAIANYVNRAHFPYVLGGGHQGTPAPFGPFDCSGAVSYLVQQAGWDMPTTVSGGMTGWFHGGRGDDFTILANPEHVYAVIGGKAWGTSDSNPGGGAGWIDGYTYRGGFAERHPMLATNLPAGGGGGGGGGGPTKEPPKPGIGGAQLTGGPFLMGQQPVVIDPPTGAFGALPGSIVGCTLEIQKLRQALNNAKRIIAGLKGAKTAGDKKLLAKWIDYRNRLRDRIHKLTLWRRKLLERRRSRIRGAIAATGQLPAFETAINVFHGDNSPVTIAEERALAQSDYEPTDSTTEDGTAVNPNWLSWVWESAKLWQTKLSAEWNWRDLLSAGESAGFEKVKTQIDPMIAYIQALLHDKRFVKQRPDLKARLGDWQAARRNIVGPGTDSLIPAWGQDFLDLQGHGITHGPVSRTGYFGTGGPPGSYFGYGFIRDDERSIAEMFDQATDAGRSAQEALAQGGGGADGTTDNPALQAIIDIQRQQLEQLQKIIYVSQLQGPVAADFAGSFGGGGTVPGPVGKPWSAIVHGGEKITPPGAEPNIEVHVHTDPRGFNHAVSLLVNGQLRRLTRAAEGGTSMGRLTSVMR